MRKQTDNCKFIKNFLVSKLLHFLALDLLQSMAKVQKCRVSGTFLVVSKYQAAIIMHALPHKTAKGTKASFELFNF